MNRSACPLDFAVGDSQSWPITLVRAGSDELNSLVGFDIGSVSLQPRTISPIGGPDEAPSEDGGDGFGSETQEVPAVDESEAAPSASGTDVVRGEERAGARRPAEQDIALSRDLYAACRQRAFPVEEPDPANILVGPSLLAVSMALRAGAALRPIEAALDDLAREVGVNSISVENDPVRPFHVRFLVERREREFPGSRRMLPRWWRWNERATLASI
jgi:hypothetical protein